MDKYVYNAGALNFILKENEHADLTLTEFHDKFLLEFYNRTSEMIRTPGSENYSWKIAKTFIDLPVGVDYRTRNRMTDVFTQVSMVFFCTCVSFLQR